MNYNNLLKYYGKYKDVRILDILLKRNGLYSGNAKKYTLQELADEYGVTRERIRQLQANGYRKIRSSIKYIGNDINEILSSFFDDKKYLTGEELYDLLKTEELYNCIYLTLLIGGNALDYDIIHGDETFIFKKSEVSNFEELENNKVYKKPIIPKKKVRSRKKINKVISLENKTSTNENLTEKINEKESFIEKVNNKLLTYKDNNEVFNVKELFSEEFKENKSLITEILASEMKKNLVFMHRDICRYYDKYDIETWEIGELTKLIGGLMRDKAVTILYIDEVYNRALTYCPDILEKYKIQGEFHFYYFLKLYLKNDYTYKNLYIKK